MAALMDVRAALRQVDAPRHRAELYRMWAASHAAGMSHPASLDAMGERGAAEAEAARAWLLRGTRRGRDLTELVGTGGDRFDDLERALIGLGEESGQLDATLRLLGDFFARKHALMLRVKKKLAYPFFTALAACFIAPFPLLFFGRPAAYLMAALAGAALLFLAGGSFILAMAARYGRSPPMARARMARALATGVEAGLTLPRAVRLAAAASANPEIRGFVGRTPERRFATTSIGASLAGCPHLTPDFLAVLETAERTGDFTALARLADLYEEGLR